MTPSHPLLAALTVSLGLGTACTPSSSPSRQPSTSADSAAEAPLGRVSDPQASACTAPSQPTPAPPRTVAEPPVALTPPPPPLLARPVPVPVTSGPYRVRIVDASGRALPTFAQAGRTYVMGSVGDRYSVVIANPTARRVEAVVSVDGLDAIDGHAASYATKRGYILPAFGDATIDGFRTSYDEVATFRFSSVTDSYAARLGQARDVGVIGVAFFPEREPVAYYRPAPEDLAPRHDDPPAPTRPRAAYGPSEDVAPAPAAQAPATSSAGAGRSAAAPKARGYDDSSADARRGLGTEFGEARESRVSTTEFVRQSASSPSQVVAIRYNDRAGLVALGVMVPPPAYADPDLRLRETASPFRETRFAQPPP